MCRPKYSERLPKAEYPADFWRNILAKVDAIGEIPRHRWDWRLYYDADRNAPDRIYSKWGGFLDDLPFDPTRYGMPPTSVKSVDPMQLMALEVARRALADAGYEQRAFDRENTSVILGASGGGGASGYAGTFGEDGGNGGFGGGGGAGNYGLVTDGDPGNGGFFGGNGRSRAGGGGAGRDAPRFQHEDLAFGPRLVLQGERHARRLAGAGRRDKDGDVRAAQRRGQRRQGFVDGER